MHTHFLSTLNRLAWLLKRNGGRAPADVTAIAPLDPVERLHRAGSTFPVVMEFSRLGW